MFSQTVLLALISYFFIASTLMKQLSLVWNLQPENTHDSIISERWKAFPFFTIFQVQATSLAEIDMKIYCRACREAAMMVPGQMRQQQV